MVSKPFKNCLNIQKEKILKYLLFFTCVGKEIGFVVQLNELWTVVCRLLTK
jgi:hypothetical protein